MVAFGILCGLASAFTSLLTQIVGPYNIGVDDAGYLGAAFIVAGLVGAIITGIFIDKTGRHKIVIKIYVPIIGALYLAFYFVGKVLITTIKMTLFSLTHLFFFFFSQNREIRCHYGYLCSLGFLHLFSFACFP